MAEGYVHSINCFVRRGRRAASGWQPLTSPARNRSPRVTPHTNHLSRQLRQCRHTLRMSTWERFSPKMLPPSGHRRASYNLMLLKLWVLNNRSAARRDFHMLSQQIDMSEHLPQEALVRILQSVPIKERSLLACVNRSWHAAARVDAVKCKISDSHVPSHVHIELPDEAAQMQAAACPVVSLARSAEIALSPASGRLMESMRDLEVLSVSCAASQRLGSSIGSLRSLSNLRSLSLNVSDAAPVLEAVPVISSTVTSLALQLQGDSWSEDVLQHITEEVGVQAGQLRHLSLRCSHAALYSRSEPLQGLALLTALSSLRLGPSPLELPVQRSPLGFARFPSCLDAMRNLRYLDISIADVVHHACITGISFDAIAQIPEIDLTLRADTSLREIFALPPALASLQGLKRLVINSFTFEDPGGWATHGTFHLSPLAACNGLRHLDLKLHTWGTEHFEAFQLVGLELLTQLTSLDIRVGVRPLDLPVALTTEVRELLLTLPVKHHLDSLHLSVPMNLVLRNSRALVHVPSPAVLAHSILWEEAVQAPPAAATGATNSSCSSDSGRSSGDGDQIPAAAAAAAEHAQQVQYVRAEAHVVISALRELWVATEVWQYPLATSTPHKYAPEQGELQLLCKAGVDQAGLLQQLLEPDAPVPAAQKAVRVA